MNEAREQAKEIEIAKATTERLREDGISDSALVLLISDLSSRLWKSMPIDNMMLSWKSCVVRLE